MVSLRYYIRILGGIMSYVLTVTLNPCIDRTVTVDGFRVGGLNRAMSERVDVGGKGINVSKVLSAMGHPTVATGIAFGKVGKDILFRLDELGIPHDFVLSESRNSRTNLKLLDSLSGEVTEIGGIGGEVDDRLLDEFIRKYTSLLSDAELVVLSGSAPKGIPRDIYATLIGIARKHGVKAILDADGDLLRNGINAAPYMIKPNIFELSRLFGREISDTELERVTRSLLDQGIEKIAVSMGKDGSVFADKNEFLRVSALKISGGCATGAGDSMVAASAYGIVHGFDLKPLARYASAAGSATASKDGTEVCTMQEIVEGAEKVKLE